MEYLVPLLLTFFVIYTILIITSKWSEKYFKEVAYSQSSMHNRLRYFMPNIKIEREKILSQSDKHINKNMIKVIVIGGKAYWIAENIFYTAEMNNGNIISETAQQIDTSEMSKDELDKMLTILDNLNGVEE